MADKKILAADLLREAINNGNYDAVKYLIDQEQVDPLCSGKDGGDTPLHLAARLGHTKIVRFLAVEKRCDAACRNIDGNTPLNLAALYGHLDVIMLLIMQCTPCVRGKHGRTPLHDTCQNGHLHVVKYLAIEVEIDPSYQSDDFGSTPLHIAARFGHTTIVRFLAIEMQCNAECRNGLGNTPLHRAALCGQLEVVKLLVNEKRCNPMLKGRWGRTPLHYACEGGHLNVVKFLIDEVGLDVSCQDDRLGDTPLHLTCQVGCTEIVRFLTLTRECNVECRNSIEDTPLHRAARCGCLDVVKLLIDKKRCNPMIRGGRGKTLLHCALEGRHQNMVKYLMQQINPAQWDDELFDTVFHIASQSEWTEIVTSLKKARCTDRLGHSDLHEGTPLNYPQHAPQCPHPVIRHQVPPLLVPRTSDEDTDSISGGYPNRHGEFVRPSQHVTHHVEQATDGRGGGGGLQAKVNARYDDVLATVDRTQLDRNNHFYVVRRALAPLEAKWKLIGSALGLKPDNLDMIELKHRSDPPACLTDTVDDWLKQNYDVQRFGPPTWQKVVEVVGDEVAGRNPALAKEIASKHKAGSCNGPDSLYHQAMPDMLQDDMSLPWWLHSDILERRIAEERLSAAGYDCFLIRNNTSYEGDYSLSIAQQGTIRHFRIVKKILSGQCAASYELEGSRRVFNGLPALVEYYRAEDHPIAPDVNPLVMKAICPRSQF